MTNKNQHSNSNANKGFASMPKEEVREIAKKGGKSRSSGSDSSGTGKSSYSRSSNRDEE